MSGTPACEGFIFAGLCTPRMYGYMNTCYGYVLDEKERAQQRR